MFFKMDYYPKTRRRPSLDQSCSKLSVFNGPEVTKPRYDLHKCSEKDYEVQWSSRRERTQRSSPTLDGSGSRRTSTLGKTRLSGSVGAPRYKLRTAVPGMPELCPVVEHALHRRGKLFVYIGDTAWILIVVP
eukprot:s5564_g11.t1